jgi:hypothetical protein
MDNARIRELRLNHNPLTSLPVEIGMMTGLKDLDLYNNQLSSLPVEIGMLTGLRQLYLNNNKARIREIVWRQFAVHESLALEAAFGLYAAAVVEAEAAGVDPHNPPAAAVTPAHTLHHESAPGMTAVPSESPRRVSLLSEDTPPPHPRSSLSCLQALQPPLPFRCIAILSERLSPY